MAHELRTPLMAASGFLQMMQKGAMNGAQLTAGIDTVARNAQQIVSLVNDILFLQEMDLVLPEFQSVAMNAVTQAVTEKSTTKAVERDVNLRFAHSPNLSPFSGDAKSLERALTALVDNAIKFSPNGGDVNVRLRDQGVTIVFDVEDHGIGIPKQNMSRIFDRFYHLDRQGEDLFGGIGLGLAITKQVIEQHQGTLTVASTPGRGSTFTIALKKWM